MVRITKNLTYLVTHNGWTIDVTSNQPIGVKPKDGNSLSIISLGTNQGDGDEC
jgi:hypothetical protein